MQDTSGSDASFLVVELEMNLCNFWVVVLENWMFKENGNFSGYCICPDTYSHFTDLNLVINTDVTWRNYHIASDFMTIPPRYTFFDTFEEARQAARDRNRLKSTEMQIYKSIEYLNTLKKLHTANFKLERFKTIIQDNTSKRLEVLEKMLPIKTLAVLKNLEASLKPKYSLMNLACKLLFDILTDEQDLVESLYKILNAFFTADSRFLCIKIDNDGNKELKNLIILNKIKTYLNFSRRYLKTDDLMKKWFFE